MAPFIWLYLRALPGQSHTGPGPSCSSSSPSSLRLRKRGKERQSVGIGLTYQNPHTGRRVTRASIRQEPLTLQSEWNSSGLLLMLSHLRATAFGHEDCTVMNRHLTDNDRARERKEVHRGRDLVYRILSTLGIVFFPVLIASMWAGSEHRNAASLISSSMRLR